MEEGEITQHLNNLIQILLEEEDRLCSNTPTPLPGPCLDLFFREDIPHFLCTICLQNVNFIFQGNFFLDKNTGYKYF